jgi:hypothetical protein
MSIVGLSASNLATKKGILHTQTFWQLTRQSLPVRLALRGRQLAPHTESKFGLLRYTEYQKTLYAAHQLRGTAGAWWPSYIATLPDDHHVLWGEFHTTFRAHHLSVGLLCIKLNEFLYLEQGNHSVFDYTRQFNTLAQYGTYHVDTDEKKANLYRAGLTIHL